LALEADKSTSRDEVQEIVVPRGEYHQPYFTFSTDLNAAEYIGRRPARLAVLTAGPSTLRGREPARRATRATQKAQEVGPTRSKSKGKGKANADNKAKEEARVERLRKVKAEIAVLQDIIDQLES
jgi:hypothetical protein